MKTCKRCEISKPEKEFGKHAYNKDGLKEYCNDCLHTMYPIKTCSVCHKEKHFSEFNMSVHNKDGLSSYCKECRKVIGKKYKDNVKPKTCSKCGITKQRKDFYECTISLDGKFHECKSCCDVSTNHYFLKTRKDNLSHYNKYWKGQVALTRSVRNKHIED